MLWEIFYRWQNHAAGPAAEFCWLVPDEYHHDFTENWRELKVFVLLRFVR